MIYVTFCIAQKVTKKASRSKNSLWLLFNSLVSFSAFPLIRFHVLFLDFDPLT